MEEIRQEITEEEYDRMLNALPPMRLPRIEETAAYFAGFQLPLSWGYANDKPLYPTYANNNKQYYFIGYLPRN